MPPHVDRTEPPMDGILKGDTLVFHGWSFAFLVDAAVVVVDSEGRPVDFERTFDGEWVGEGDAPGSRQYRSVLRVRLQGLVPGARYRARFMECEVAFVAE